MTTRNRVAMCAPAGRALDEMAPHVGAGLAVLATGLSPGRIMVIGEVTRAWRRTGPIIDRVLAKRCRWHARPEIEAVQDADQPRLRGTIALVIQKHFAAPSLVRVHAKGAGI